MADIGEAHLDRIERKPERGGHDARSARGHEPGAVLYHLRLRSGCLQALECRERGRRKREEGGGRDHSSKNGRYEHGNPSFRVSAPTIAARRRMPSSHDDPLATCSHVTRCATDLASAPPARSKTGGAHGRRLKMERLPIWRSARRHDDALRGHDHPTAVLLADGV